MTSRRADVAPGLLDRVRWGNVGRLAALLAGVILVVTGPHGCGPARGMGDRRWEIGDLPEPPALPPVVKEASSEKARPISPSLPVVREKQQSRKHRRQHHGRARKRARPGPMPLQSPIPQSPISPPPAAPAPPPPPMGGAGEFAP